MSNSRKILGSEDIGATRKRLAERGVPVDQMTDDDIEAVLEEMAVGFRENAPTTAAQAAEVIIGEALSGQWRILVGDDARSIDELVRSDPEAAYEADFIDRIRARGHLQMFLTPAED